MLTQAITGTTLGLIFILPLVFILVAWAFSKFRNSTAWRTVAWSGLVYCLTQNFIGLVALFAFPLIAAGVLVGFLLIITVAFVILVPPILGALLGYRIGISYNHSTLTAEKRKRRQASIALLTVVFILVIQVLLGLFLLNSLGAT